MVSRFFGLAMLALGFTSFTVETASAQGLPWSRQGEYLYRQQRYYAPPTTVVPEANSDSIRSFYPANIDYVRIDVIVPANAKVSFDGVNTKQVGTNRNFYSPSLQPGFRYSYDIQATWMENGKQVTQRRTVPVGPGDRLNIVFTRDSMKVNRID